MPAGEVKGRQGMIIVVETALYLGGPSLSLLSSIHYSTLYGECQAKRELLPLMKPLV